MGPATRTSCLALALIGFAAGGSGCALPVIEGVFDQRDFALFDDTPEARADSGDEVLLVFLDVDRAVGQLRTVSVDLRGLSSLPAGEPAAVGTGAWDDDRPAVEVVEGTFIEETLEGGAVLMTTGDDARRATSEAGSVTVDEQGDTVAGRFTVDLDDGGFLTGTFRSQR
ncbi:MAG: hypothetical protein FJ137_17980 [Deltaproteobacteria bacterium]|nr:hypothetical protein [Deltaproteobacteria bacterium]